MDRLWWGFIWLLLYKQKLCAFCLKARLNLSGLDLIKDLNVNLKLY